MSLSDEQIAELVAALSEMQELTNVARAIERAKAALAARKEG